MTGDDELTWSHRPASSLTAFLRALPLAGGSVLRGGGSNATVRRFESGGLSYVVKYVRTGTELVDGHDARTLAVKADQLALLRRQCPGLAGRLVEPVDGYRGHDGTALVMPYYDGQPLRSLLDDRDTPVPLLSMLGRVVGHLVEHGYTTWRVPADRGTFARLHLDRVTRRLPVVRRFLPGELLAPDLVVNGERGVGIDRLLVRLQARPRLLDLLDPPWLHTPVHGDLNLGNVLLRGDDAVAEYVVLDPRGVLVPWDVGYDFAKLQFSLVGLDNGMRYGFQIHRAATGFEVRIRAGQVDTYDDAADQFAGVLAGIPAVAHLVADDPHWQLRLEFSVAMHALAEAGCRISDRKVRRVGPHTGRAAQVELAAGLHLMGTVLLARLLDRSDRELASDAPPRTQWQGG